MSELHTFETGDKRFRFVVKSNFLSKCPTPELFDSKDLLTKYKMNQFLHNPMGPAIIRLKDNFVEYWIDGQLVSKEIGEKIAHNSEFSTKLTAVINDDSE